ncbi:MAG: hypothetical protein ACRDX9_09465, partial [Acidimicrobiia bacterium]
VIAIGVGFTLSQDEPASVSDVQPAHPTVSDDRRPQADFVSERQMLRNAAIAAAALEYQEQIDFLRYRDQASADLEYQEHIDVLRYSVSDANARINEPAFQAESDRLTVEGVGGQATAEQRLAHEFIDEQGTSGTSSGKNPLERVAE